MRALLLSTMTCASLWAGLPPYGLTATGDPWAPLGPDGGDARRIVADPRDHAHLYLGTANGWIYESHDTGSKWTRLAQVGKRDDLVLDSIVVDAANPNHLVVGAWVIDHPDGGLFLSQDGGATWTNQAEMRGQSIRALTASVSDPRVLVAGTLRGVFRSVDGGIRWMQISPANSTEIHNIESVALDPTNPAVIYAGTWHLPWKSTDGGEHWNSIKQGIIDDSDVFSIIVDPEQPKTVFASACSGIYKSEDAGLEFHKIQGIPSSARRTRRLLQDPHNLAVVFAGTTEGLFRSDDSGKTWNRTTGPDIIVNDVAIDLSNPKRVLIATDRGGVLASDDGGDSFRPSNRGFSARQVTALKRDVTRPDTLFAGVVNDKDWGGIFESSNGGQNWSQRSDGLEGRDVFALGQAPDGTMIAGTSHGLFRLDPSAQEWKRVESAPGTPTKKESIEAILNRPAIAGTDRSPPTVPSVVASATTRKVASRKPTAHKPHLRVRLAMTRKHPAPVRRRVAVTRVAKPPMLVPSQSRTFDGGVYSIATAGNIVVATTSVGLLTSVDNGESWAATGPDDSSQWRYLAAARRYVVAASLNTMAASSNSGIVWVPIKLPETMTQIAAVAIEPNGELWVGGREGIFVSSDGGANWSIPENLYLTAVNNIFYDDTANRMMITTSGNASLVFSVQLPSKSVSFADSGWMLRFARPMGDHIVAATLFDGIVVQPRMVISPLAPTRASKPTPPKAEVAGPPQRPPVPQ